MQAISSSQNFLLQSMESRLLKGRLLEVRERKEMDRMRKAMKE
jgi:hypothetical protein